MKALMGRLKSKPTDVVGIDVGTAATKVVRMQRHGQTPTVVAAEILPAVRFAAEDSPEPPHPPLLELPPRLKGRYGCLAFTGENAVIKLLTFPGAFDEHGEERLVESMGLENPENYRLAYKVVSEGHGRSESRVLGVAVLEKEAQMFPRLLASGFPVPFSLEVSGLASMTAFLHTIPSSAMEQALGVIEFGASVSTLALFNRGVLALIRRFNFGVSDLLAKVRAQLGVDEETARGIISDGSFDISQSVVEVLDPLVKQLRISRDFVERRENCRLAGIYVSGALARAGGALGEIEALMEIEVLLWNPLENLRVAKGALPEWLTGSEWQLAGAVGACLATFEET